MARKIQWDPQSKYDNMFEQLDGKMGPHCVNSTEIPSLFSGNWKEKKKKKRVMLFMSNGMNLYHITICIGGWMEYTRFTAIHEK